MRTCWSLMNVTTRQGIIPTQTSWSKSSKERSFHMADKRYLLVLPRREFYHTTPQGLRPRILGLTASPLKTKATVGSCSIYTDILLNASICISHLLDDIALKIKLIELQRTLDSKIVSTKFQEELLSVVSRPDEIEVEYNVSSTQAASFLFMISLKAKRAPQFYRPPYSTILFI